MILMVIRKIYSFLFFSLFSLLLIGCATPVRHINIPLASYDKNTKYGVEDNSDGFNITVFYSRYQFIPESDAVATACKSILTSIAWEIAEKKEKKILPINEQIIRLSMGRNGLTGITSCQASVVVQWDS